MRIYCKVAYINLSSCPTNHRPPTPLHPNIQCRATQVPLPLYRLAKDSFLVLLFSSFTLCCTRNSSPWHWSFLLLSPFAPYLPQIAFFSRSTASHVCWYFITEVNISAIYMWVYTAHSTTQQQQRDGTGRERRSASSGTNTTNQTEKLLECSHSHQHNKSSSRLLEWSTGSLGDLHQIPSSTHTNP